MSDCPAQEEPEHQASPENHPSFAQTCDFMKYLEPSNEAIQDEQQNPDENGEMYHTLSSGVYESSDAYEAEFSSEVQVAAHCHQQTHNIEVEEKMERYQLQKEGGVLAQSAPVREYANEGTEQVEQYVQKVQQKVQTVYESGQKNQIEQKVASAKMEAVPDSDQQQKIQYPSMQMQPHVEEEEQTSIQPDHVLTQTIQQQHQNQQQQQSEVHIYMEESTKEPQQRYEELIIHQQMEEEETVQEQPRFYMPKTVLPPLPMHPIESIEVDLHKFGNFEDYEGVQVAITGYQVEYFLKIQTQIFRIDVHRKDKQYVIKRRFSDFATLDKLIKHHYPGSIIYPLPQKSLQLFKKVKLSMGSEQQKIIIIEKRLMELQKYLKFLLAHREISTSIILQIFLQQSSDIFQKETSNLLAISLEQEKELQLGIIQENYSSIKKIMKSGFNFINSYLSSSEASSDLEARLQQLQANAKKSEQLFLGIRAQVEECTQKLSNFSSNIERLAAIHRQNAQTSNIDTNIDSVLKLSSKMSSSRAFSERHAEWIDDNLVYHIRYYELLLRSIGHSINYRQQLVSKISLMTAQGFAVAEKIEEKIQLFEGRFLLDWTTVKQQIQQNLAILYDKFNLEWRSHCQLMLKIWR